ncbi:MAG: HIT family protein [Furfurilactobacillus sp.]|jgi:histidine triad (HIT) family protein|uniref:HIT family protein n=1 Tax=Furfurilactobacillus milii TaxID=2888272 RepID=A0ABT6D8J3_9LACO|nr:MULTISPECIES: HIT family protein [Furfurilactobacillus]QLE66758.1 Histidine triad HIT nucleotide-binding protein [Furfurilactobacillus rossiae]MCF6160643.1 HIT family protein [Furfurilactobacillus milii]MCF6162875.1 HIT family protein [Furfurilactobacillus milii]MCF6420205.1 HIT family protein [Furfurilactobacillus milii]MCH4010475.1 HIT family protein [Furfurilactobacillus sp.]
MLDDNCIFCKIIKGEIPSYTVYEDDEVKAFLDISQGTPGHTLVIPKTHVPDIFAYDEDLAQRVFARIPKIARAVRASNPNIVAMNIVNNNGKVAYQSVFHSHFHIVPRYSDDDDFKMIFKDNSDNYDDAAYRKIQQDIMAHMEA